MADYYQVKNQNIFTPPANISLGNTSNQYSNVYVQNNLVVGNVTVTSSTIIAPRVTTITYPGNDTAADPAGGQTITLTGSGFVVSASILINSIAVSVVSVVSSTVITFTSPANSSGSYVIYVVNPDGSTAIAVPGIQYSGIPTWTTAAGTLGSLYETASFTESVVATGDAPITYSVASGTLPPGATFNGNGTITGTSQLTASPTTYTFIVSATDAEQQDTNRSFSLTINTDVVTWTTPAANSTTTLGQNVASTTTLLATSAAGKAITYTANALPTGLSISGATVTGTPTVVGNTSSLFTATAATTGRTTTATINWTITVSSDTYFPYTTLLLSGGTSTSTFIADAITNNFAVAIAGDTKPNNFNPYTPGYYSNYFDGTGDYLTVPYSSVFDYGTGDFTIEAWIYLTITPYQGDAIFCSLTTGGSAFQFYSSTQLALGNTGIAWRAISNSTSFPICTWHHVAVSRASGTAYFWLNGVNIGTVAETNAFNAASSAIAIGKSDAGLFTGYISNLRVLKGTALYTTTFTPSTTPLTAIANTSLLTCQSNRFVDNSTNAFVVTKYGDTTVNPNNPFVPDTAYAAYGSTYFDGTGDYLTIPITASGPLDFGSGNWTVEAWVMYTGASLTGGYRNFLTFCNNSGLPYIQFGTKTSTGYVFAEEGTSVAVPWTVAGTTLLTSNVWHHIATVRNSNNIYLYLDGVLQGSVAYSGTHQTFAKVQIGSITYNGNVIQDWTGYISNARIIKGTAVYTSAFTPPSTPLTAITNTSLLTLQTNQPVNNNVFLDSSTNSFTITRNGNTTQGSFSPYGPNWSLYTNGTSSYAYLPYSATRAIGTGDFSIECWVYIARQPANYTRVWSHQSNWGLAGSIGVELAFGTIDSVIQTLIDGNSTTYASATYDTSGTGGSGHVRQWIHVVSSRQNGYLRLFVNGILREAAANSTNINGTSNTSFGTNSQLGGDLTEMYISNFRMCIGSVPTLYSTTSTTAGTTIFTPSTTPVTTTGQGATGVQLLVFQDNRIIDRSSNAFAVTAVNNPSIQRFSPFSPGAAYSTSTIGGSVYFDGNGDYLTAPANAAFDFGTGDFTIEVWVYPISNGLNYPTFLGSVTGWSDGASGHRFNNTGYANKFWFGRNGSGGVASGDPFMASTNTFSFNVWHHYSITRSGNTFRMFVNGALENTQTFSGSYNAGLGGLRSGWSTWDGAGGYFTGYTSNLRMLKGTALYTTTFTPPTAPLTAITNTSLLLNMTSAGIVDATMINDLETVGDAKILSTQTPYAGSYYSNLFDGTGDYLTVPSNAALAPSTGDFTCEAWISISVLPSSGGVAAICQNDAILQVANNTKFWFGVYNNSGTSQLYLGRHDTANRAFVNWTPTVGVWYHVAAVRQSGTVKLFIDGVLQTVTGSTDLSGVSFSQGGFTVGAISTPVYMNGYISNFRYVVGTAVYTSSFTPSTTPLTAIANTVLLTCQSNRFLDNSTNAFAVTRTGDTSVQSFNPFQRNSAATMYFDGTTDALFEPSNLSYGYGTGDFTIEVWLYLNATTTQTIVSNLTASSGASVAPHIYYANASGIRYYVNSADRITGSALSTGTWYHIAVSRSGSSTKMFINGTQTGSTYTDTNNYGTSNPLGVGDYAVPLTGGSTLNGYINDLRITKGVARYTSTFTPPTSAFLTT